MGKNNFYQLKNQFPQAGIATSEFQKLQQSSEKKLFPLDRNPVLTSRNEEFVKKYVST